MRSKSDNKGSLEQFLERNPKAIRLETGRSSEQLANILAESVREIEILLPGDKEKGPYFQDTKIYLQPHNEKKVLELEPKTINKRDTGKTFYAEYQITDLKLLEHLHGKTKWNNGRIVGRTIVYT